MGLLGECGDVARDVLLEPGGPPGSRGGGGGHTSSLVRGYCAGIRGDGHTGFGVYIFCQKG